MNDGLTKWKTVMLGEIVIDTYFFLNILYICLHGLV